MNDVKFDANAERLEALKRHHEPPQPEKPKELMEALNRQRGFEGEVSKKIESMRLGGVPSLPARSDNDAAMAKAVRSRLSDTSLPPCQREAMARYVDRLTRRQNGLKWS